MKPFLTQNHVVNDSCIIQCTFRLISKISLTLSLCHLFVVSRISVKGGQVIVNENFETDLEVHCVMQLLLSYSTAQR